MLELGPEHPITYRQEIVSPIFQHLISRESMAIVGVASMGKSRLLQFIQRDDVRQQYLSREADKSLLIVADCNRMAEISPWGLHELLLTALTEAVGRYPETVNLRDELNRLRKEAIIEQTPLLAQRHVELTLKILCHEHRLHICLIFDEFDESFRSLPPQSFSNLRAFRDANKYSLSFILFLRDHPALLRTLDDCEGFYELISRSILGLQPYQKDDARRVLQQIATRRGHELQRFDEQSINQIIGLSGGHPGLLVALGDEFGNSQPIGTSWLDWALGLPKVDEECRKIWNGLRNEEKLTLNHLAQKIDTKYQHRESLLLKGLIHENSGHQFIAFSPLFERYAASHAPTMGSKLHIDTQAGTVWINGEQSTVLTQKEFQLITYLHTHLGEICETGHIIEHLYPGLEGLDVNDNSVAAIVKRIREKIEPNPKQPLYLRNFKGRGYQLVNGSP